MGKNKRDYQEEEESYGYGSEQSSGDSEASSGTSASHTSDSGGTSSGDTDRERRRRHVKRKSSRPRREKRAKRSDRSEDEEEDEEEVDEYEDRRKRMRHPEEYGVRGEEERRHHSSSGGSSRRKKHHHHRKHKHKHRRHRRHHSEEQSRGGASLERGEARRGREGEERRAKDRLEGERRAFREVERRDRKEDKKYREKGKSESRQMRSKWDDEDDLLYDTNKRIKVEPGIEEEEEEEAAAEVRRRKQRRQENSQRSPNRIKSEPHKTLSELRETRVKAEPRDGEHRDRGAGQQDAENGRDEWGTAGGGGRGGEDPGATEEKLKPNMALSGKLAEDANTYNGVVIKYSQPSEARKPKRRWRWYIFKGDEELPFLPLHRQSAYLIGRDRKVADIPTDHPSCSKQHAVLQYRLVSYSRGDGTKGRTVKPYILDLDSANGTFINNRKIEAKRFIELLEKDVVKFGYSSREYILLHEGSRGDEDSLPDTGADLSPVSLLRS